MNNETLTLLDLLAKGTAVLLLSLGGITCMRRCSAAHRSLAWLAGFGALLVLPLAGLVHPIWTVPVMTVKAELPLEKAAPLPTVPLEASNDTSTMSAPAMPVSPTWSMEQRLAAIYITGIIALLAFRLIGSSQLRRLKYGATPPGTHIQSLVNELRQKHRIYRTIEVFLSDRINVPMTWGTIKPVLMLPSDCMEWSNADLRAALEHELAHIRHLDAARRWLATFVSALWWPHPLVWIASKAWRLEQERACDDAVVRSGADAERYAEQLLQAASAMRLGSFQSAAALVMAVPSGLETRLHAVVGTDVNRSTIGRATSIITLTAGLLLVTVCAICQAQTVTPAKEVPRQIIITTRFVEFARQIIITTRFVEFASDNPGGKHPTLQKALDGTPVILSDTEMQELWRQLGQKKGVHRTSAPVVITRSGQKATVEVVREFIYPIAFEKDNDKPTAFDMMPIGVMVDVEPAFKSNGAIRLYPIEARVNEFLGYMAGGRLHPAPKDKDTNRYFGLSHGANSADDRMEKLLRELPKDGRESQPVFLTRKWSGDVSLKQGQWLVSYLKPTDDAGKDDNRRIWFFVSANEVVPDAKK